VHHFIRDESGCLVETWRAQTIRIVHRLSVEGGCADEHRWFASFVAQRFVGIGALAASNDKLRDDI
jgi:hypothetical protein